MRTGYFANTETYTKVHVVDENTKPICNSKIAKNKSFQFSANYIEYSYIECEKCKKKARKLLRRELENKLN